MTYYNQLGKPFHFCRRCKHKDYTCSIFCTECGIRQRTTPRSKGHRAKLSLPRIE